MRAIIKGEVTITPTSAIPLLLKPIKKIDEQRILHLTRLTQSNETNQLELLLLQFLIDKGWIPNLDHDTGLVKNKMEEILGTIKDEHLPLVKDTFMTTIIHSRTYSWGIVNRPVNTSIEFRLKQPIAHKLRDACQELVNHLHGAILPFQIKDENDTHEGKIQIALFGLIEVLEPGSEHQAFVGKIYKGNRFKLAIEQKSTDYMVGIIAGILALFLLLITAPPLVKSYQIQVSQQWFDWTKGTLDRLATSSVFASAVAWINVFLYWRRLQAQRTTIEWTTAETGL